MITDKWDNTHSVYVWASADAIDALVEASRLTSVFIPVVVPDDMHKQAKKLRAALHEALTQARALSDLAVEHDSSRVR